jgi:uncharacterized protein (DUF2126 family)
LNTARQRTVQLVAHSSAACEIAMTESFSRLESDHVRVIASLSDKLKIPVHEVDEIYKREFDRLALQARIPTFLVVLAMRNTRSILRGRHLH